MQRAANPSSSGWFEGAPTSKFLAISSITALIMYRHVPLHRIIMTPYTNKWIFRPGSGESFLGTALLVHWSKNLERQTGSRKFVTFLLMIQFMVIAMEQLMQLIIIMRPDKNLYMGPYPVLGAYFLWFHLHVPRIHPRFVQILGFTFSEKSIGYLWFSWIVACEGKNSILAAIMGMLSWVLYRRFLENKMDVPDILVTIISPYSSRFLETPPPIIPNIRMVAPRAVMTPRTPMIPQPQPPSEPPTAAIEQLVGMGFPRAQVIQALQASNNSVERAADRLLSGSD